MKRKPLTVKKGDLASLLARLHQIESELDSDQYDEEISHNHADGAILAFVLNNEVSAIFQKLTPWTA